MFGIRSGGVWLKLAPSTRLNSTLYPPTANEDSAIRGTYSIALNVPIAGNEKFFSFRHDIKSINAAAFMESGLQAVRVYLEGTWWQEGSIKILKISDDTISINVVLGIADMIGLDKKIQDFNWDTITLPSNANPVTQMVDRLAYFKTIAAQTLYDETDPEKTFNFPVVKNPIFYGVENENNLDWEGWMNNYHDDTFIGNYYGNYNAMVPMVHVLEILRKGFDYSGYLFIYGSLGTDFLTLLQYNNYDLCELVNGLGINYESSTGYVCDGTGVDGIFGKPLPADVKIYDSINLWNIFGYMTYKIKRKGRFYLKLHLEWNAPLYQPLWLGELWFTFIVPGTVVSVNFFAGNILANNIEDIYFEFEISDDGKTITCLSNSPGFPNVSTAFTLSSGTFIDKECSLLSHFFDVRDPSGSTQANITVLTIEIDSYTHPLINRFPSQIELSKCVPQEVLFRDYLNAFASTWNVEFQVDDKVKTVTCAWIEAGIKDKATHREYAWKGNDEAAEINLRAPKYKSLGYQFDGSDETLFDNNKNINDSFSIGDFVTYSDLKSAAPAGTVYLGKYALLLEENAWYVCKTNPNPIFAPFEWAYFTDNYAPYVFGTTGAPKNMTMSPVFMRHSLLPGTDIYYPHPQFAMGANSPAFNEQSYDVGIRVFFYRGLIQIDSVASPGTNHTYPMASPLIYATNAIINTTMRIFALDAEDSIIVSMWRVNWVKTLAALNLRRLATKKLRMTLPAFLNWNFRRRARMNGMNMYTEELTITTVADERGFDVEGEFGLEEVEIE